MDGGLRLEVPRRGNRSPAELASLPSSGSNSPEPQKFTMRPMPRYEPNHQAWHLATLHRISAPRRPRTAGPSSGKKTINHRRSRSRMSGASSELEADTTKSQTTESDWMDFLEHDDFDYDADDEPPPPGALEKESPSQRLYRSACRVAKIPPASTVLRCLPEKTIAMKHHIIGPQGAKPLSIALTHNGSVEKLDLQDNNLGPLGTSHLCEMLHENDHITDLRLTENKLGSEGAKIICDLMADNENIKRLDLSGNGFKETDAKLFLEMLRSNYTLKELILSHNEFREVGGEILAKAIADNTCLETLDLSWNHLRNRGASAVGKCLTHNVGLKNLDISWNGFHLMGCRSLGKAIATNHSLEFLNVNNNRIDRECLGHLLQGLKKNSCLETLWLNQNPIGTEGAIDILNCVQKAKDPKLKELDISSVSVDVEFKQMKRALGDSGRSIFVMHGHTLHEDEASNCDAEGIFLNEDPMMVLMEFMRLKNLRLVDLFQSMDKDNSGAITKTEFRDGLMKANVPLSAAALIRLVKKLDLDRDGEVDFGELMKGQKDHKRKVSKMKKLAQERGWGFEETEVGRVSSKLQLLMGIAPRKSIRPVTSVAAALRGVKEWSKGSKQNRAKTAVGVRTLGSSQSDLLSQFNTSSNDLTVSPAASTGVTPEGSASGSPGNSRPGSALISAGTMRVKMLSGRNSRPGSAGIGSRPGSGSSRSGSGVSGQGSGNSLLSQQGSGAVSMQGSGAVSRPGSGAVSRPGSGALSRPSSGNIVTKINTRPGSGNLSIKVTTRPGSGRPSNRPPSGRRISFNPGPMGSTKEHAAPAQAGRQAWKQKLSATNVT